MTTRVPRVLVAFATKGSEGQTARIAERLAAMLREGGARADVVDVEESKPDLRASAYDAALIGGSVRAGRYRRSLRRLLGSEKAALEEIPWAFFSVCLGVAATSEAVRDASRELPRRLMADKGVRPDEIAVLAGAIRFSHHGRLGSWVLYRMNRGYLGRTDRDGDWECTDWDDVDAFAHRFLASLNAEARGAAHGATRSPGGG